jgi:hypothetical protein
MRNKAYNIFTIFYITFSNIRVSAEWKSFNAKLNIITKNIYMHEIITGYKSFFWKTLLTEVFNKL